MELKPIPVPDGNNYAETHQTGFGASEAAAVVGVDPYCSPWELYHRKTGAIPERSAEDSIHLRRGIHFEPFIVREFEIAHPERPVAEYPMRTFRHPVFPFMLATPDADLDSGDLLECKSIGWRLADEIGEPGTNQLPEPWIIQAQQQMSVMGRQRVVFAVLVEVEKLLVFNVDRHDGIISALIEAERELWERIRDRKAPEPGDTTSLAAVKRVFRDVTIGKVVELPAELRDRWQVKEALDEQIKALEARRDAIKAECYAACGDAHIAMISPTHCIKRELRPETRVEFVRREYVDFRCVKIPKGLALPVHPGGMIGQQGAAANV